MTLRARVLVLGLLVLAALAAAAVAVLDTVDDERDARAVVRERIGPASDAARAALAGLVDQETAARGYVITGDPIFLEPYATGGRAADEALDRVMVLVRSPATLTVLRRVSTLVDRWRAEAALPEIRARRRGDVEGARRAVSTARGKVLFDRMRGQLEVVQRRIDAVADAASDRADDNADALRAQLLALGIALLVLVVVTLLALRRWMLVPLRRLQAALREITAGDLTRRIEATGPPETRSLARDAEGMRRRILDELERSEGARAALEQRGPVVAGLRRELDASAPPAVPGVASAGVLHAVEGVLAGDWYDVIALPDGTVGLLIVDVSGHGAEAGLVAVRLKHVLTAALRLGVAPDDALAVVAPDFADPKGRFATCVIVVVDPRSGRTLWANAGHPPPLVIARGGIVGELGATGPLLSTIGGGWETCEHTLQPGDIVLAYTDGLTEARAGADGFGEERLRRAVVAAEEHSADGMIAACLAAARDHAREQRRDDVTIAALQFAGAGVPAGAPTQVGPR